MEWTNTALPTPTAAPPTTSDGNCLADATRSTARAAAATVAPTRAAPLAAARPNTRQRARANLGAITLFPVRGRIKDEVTTKC